MMNLRDPLEVQAWRHELTIMQKRLPPGPYLATVARSIELIDALYPPAALSYFCRQQTAGLPLTDRYREGYDQGYAAGYRAALEELLSEVKARLHPAEVDQDDYDY